MLTLRNTHIGSVGIHDPNDLTGYSHSQSHGLCTLVSAVILEVPVDSPHTHEVIQNPISEHSQIASSEFLAGNANGVPPEVVIKEALIQDVFSPALLIKPLLPWEDCSM